MKKERKKSTPATTVGSNRSILNVQTPFSIVEEYKMLRTAVSFAASVGVGNCKIVGITSPLPSDGKSITCMNLAIAFAMTEAKVLLIDCDLRRPVIAQSFFRASSPGISNVLAGISEEDEALREVTYNGVYFHIIPSGDIPPNPSELLGSPRAENVFASLAEKYDYIFVDLPPIGVVSDALVLSKLLTGLIMVVRFGRTKRDDVKRALERINLAGADMLGFVLNDAKRTKNKRYYADKYSGYGNAPNR